MKHGPVPPELDATADQLERLTTYLSLLQKWQARINLVGAGTLTDAWRRHILDSAQLRRYLPDGSPIIADLGSGAGFPGLVLAILGAGRVHLIESDGRKAAFLNEARRITEAPATVHPVRIESYTGPVADVVVSRALAPLDALLGHAETALKPGGKALFLKGRQWQDELTAARGAWHIEATHHPSLADPAGVVLDIDAFNRPA
ncbi:MAG: 16S rRNA (guanine(527)-N(7))-methyltransferase RsmG [Rhodospirillales bacterium]